MLTDLPDFEGLHGLERVTRARVRARTHARTDMSATTHETSIGPAGIFFLNRTEPLRVDAGSEGTTAPCQTRSPLLLRQAVGSFI